MSKTVAEMVGEARARVETVSPKDASVEGAAGRRCLPGRPGAGGVGASRRRRRPGPSRPARVRRRPREPQAQAGAGPGRSRDRVLPLRRPRRAGLRHAQGHGLSRTSPTSRAASAPGRRPACPPTSTMTGSEPPDRHPPTWTRATKGPTWLRQNASPPRCRWTGTKSGSPTAPWCPPTTSTRSSAGAARSTRRSAWSTPTSATRPRTTGTRTTSTTSTTSSAWAASTRRSTSTRTCAAPCSSGATWVYEGGCMAVRARDQIFKMRTSRARRSASPRASTPSRTTGGASRSTWAS